MVSLNFVALHAAMKSGLKEEIRILIEKKERLVSLHAPMKRGLKVIRPTNRRTHSFRFTPCPDEKGTESKRSISRKRRIQRVSLHAPMKRGLKVTENDVIVQSS